jgi:hypothetical protein
MIVGAGKATKVGAVADAIAGDEESGVGSLCLRLLRRNQERGAVAITAKQICMLNLVNTGIRFSDWLL